MAKYAWRRWTLFAALLAGAAYGLDATLPPQPRCVIPGGHRPIKISADGSRVLTLCNSVAPLREWDTRTGMLIRTIAPDLNFDTSTRYEMSDEKKLLVTAAKDSRLVFVDLPSGLTWRSSEPIPAGAVNAACGFMPGGVIAWQRLVLDEERNQSNRLFDAATGRLLKEFKENDSRFFGVQHKPDLVFFCNSKTDETTVWSFTENRQVAAIRNTAWLELLSPNRRWLLTGKSNAESTGHLKDKAGKRRLSLWNLENLQLQQEMVLDISEGESGIAFTSDGKHLAFQKSDGDFRTEVWSVENNLCLKSLLAKKAGDDFFHFSSDPRSFFHCEVSEASALLTCWELPAMTVRWSREFSRKKDLWVAIRSAPNGRSLSVHWFGLNALDEPVYLLDASTGEDRAICRVGVSSEKSDYCRFSSEFDASGKWFACNLNLVREKGPTTHWILKWLTEYGKTPEQLKQTRRIDFYNLVSGKRRFSFHSHEAWSCSVCDDGTTLLATPDHVGFGETSTILVYDLPAKPPRAWVYGPPLALGVAVVLLAMWRRRRIKAAADVPGVARP